jgi:hypothetical protein
MKTQTMSLREAGVKPMEVLEMERVDGGGWVEVAAWVGLQIIANWAEVKKGAAAGWNSVSYR